MNNNTKKKSAKINQPNQQSQAIQLHQRVLYPQVWDEYADSCVYCSELVDYILVKTNDQCYENHLQKEFPNYNSRISLWIQSTLIDQQFYKHDINIDLDAIQEDQEPQTQQLDSRQVRRVPVRIETENQNITLRTQPEQTDAQLFSKTLNILSELLPGQKLFRMPFVIKRSISPDQSMTKTENQSIQNQEFEKFKDKYIQEALIKSKLSFLVNPEQSNIDKILNKDKERSYVRKIIQKQVLTNTINQLNSSYSNEYQQSDDPSHDLPSEKMLSKINDKYFKYIGSPRKRQLSPYNLNQQIPQVKVPRLINVPHATIEMDYKPDVRSQSPIVANHEALLKLNAERLTQKQDNFSSKLKQIIADQKQKDIKKYLINNQFFNKNEKRSPHNSPKRVDANKDQITELIQQNQKADSLPELQMKRIRIYK